MRIGGSGTTSPASTRKTGRTAPSSRESFTESLDAGTESAQTESAQAAKPAAATPLAAVDALLHLQEAPGDAEERSRGLVRAGEMLDMLEAVRRGLLLGAIPRAQLERLARLARARHKEFEDPALAELLAEIELRAEVELAKLGVSG